MERQFDGIYIPAEIWNAKDLNWNEKILLMEINSYTRNGKDCFISNEYIAKFLNVTETSGNRILSSLIKKGYVDKVRFDGRRRFIKSNIVVQVKADLSQSAEQGCHKGQGRVVTNDSILYTDTISNITNKKYIDKSIYKESASDSKQALKIKEDKFDRFWEIYDKKVGKSKAKAYFMKLKDDDILNMAKVIHAYVASRPDKKYRPDPERFIKNRVWEDEIINFNEGVKQQQSSSSSDSDQEIKYLPDGTFTEGGYRFYMKRNGERSSIRPNAPDRPNDGYNWDYSIERDEWYKNE